MCVSHILCVRVCDDIVGDVIDQNYVRACVSIQSFLFLISRQNMCAAICHFWVFFSVFLLLFFWFVFYFSSLLVKHSIGPDYFHDFAFAELELLLLLTADVLLFELALSNPVINVSMINLIVSL